MRVTSMDGLIDEVHYTGEPSPFGESGFEVFLSATPVEGEYTVQIIGAMGRPLSESVSLRTRSGCSENVAVVEFQEVQDGASETLMASDAAHPLLSAGQIDREYGDFDLSVDAEWRELPDDFGEFVVVFRMQDPEHYYALRVRADGAYRVEVVNGNPAAPETLSEWQVSPHIEIGAGAVNRVIPKPHKDSSYRKVYAFLTSAPGVFRDIVTQG